MDIDFILKEVNGKPVKKLGQITSVKASNNKIVPILISWWNNDLGGITHAIHGNNNKLLSIHISIDRNLEGERIEYEY